MIHQHQATPTLYLPGWPLESWTTPIRTRFSCSASISNITNQRDRNGSPTFEWRDHRDWLTEGFLYFSHDVTNVRLVFIAPWPPRLTPPYLLRLPHIPGLGNIYRVWAAKRCVRLATTTSNRTPDMNSGMRHESSRTGRGKHPASSSHERRVTASPSSSGSATNHHEQDVQKPLKRARGIGYVTPNACTECREKRAKVLERAAVLFRVIRP